MAMPSSQTSPNEASMIPSPQTGTVQLRQVAVGMAVPSSHISPSSVSTLLSPQIGAMSGTGTVQLLQVADGMAEPSSHSSAPLTVLSPQYA